MLYLIPKKLVTVICAVLFIVQCACQNDPEISVYSSSQDGDRLTKKRDVQFTSVKQSSLPVITVDERIRFQKIEGFGATFNEAGMICLNSLDNEVQGSVLKNAF